MKRCGRCHVEKDETEFGHRGITRTDLKSYCRPCISEEQKEYGNALKKEAFEKYGGARCACCGVDEFAFLGLDHVENNGGGKNRDCSGRNFYKWLKRNNWPDLKLQVLCHNCNLGRHINGGECPHKKFIPLA